MSRWTKLRAQAREAGRYAAQGGPDERRKYDGLGVVHAYDEGYQREVEESQHQADRDERLAPLRQIRNQADALASRSDNEEVRELSDMIRDLADYLESKDNG